MWVLTHYCFRMKKLLAVLLLLFVDSRVTEAVECPTSCKCSWILDSLEVDIRDV